ncbi:MAG TPA: trypsin-like serine protease [Planctomycetota bacterium]|nr:trypsin-like serine protease [Planctomycetota bacterium]
MMKLRVLFFVACIYSAAALGADAAPRILDGTQRPASEFPTVGLVSDAEGSFIASGTLIGPRHVLTAGHCCTDSAGARLSDTGGRFLLGGVIHKTSRVLLHPSFNLSLLGEETIVDIGIFELEAPLAVAPSPLQRSPVSPAQKLTIAGYGKLGTGKRGILNVFPESGQISTGTVTIGEVTPTFVNWVFTEGEAGTAPGDSGGPSFPEGTTNVAGVHSLGVSLNARNFGKFGTINKDARVDTSVPWIDSILTGSTSNNPPVVTTPASAMPATLRAGESVRFDVLASDPDGNTLVYIWDFGDGDAAIGATQNHAYLFPGTYAANVTISDGVAAVVVPTPVTVNADVTAPLTLKKMQLTANYQRDFQDAASLGGTLSPVPAVVEGFAKVDIGGAQELFAVDARGRGRGPAGTISINLKTGAFTVSLRKADLAGAWFDEGIRNGTGTVSVTMPVTIAVNGSVYSGTRTLVYTGREGRGGKAK